MAFFEWRRDRVPLWGMAIGLALIASQRLHWPPGVTWSLSVALMVSALYVLFTRQSRRAQVLVLLFAGLFLGSALVIDYLPMSLALRRLVGGAGLVALGAVMVVLFLDKRSAGS